MNHYGTWHILKQVEWYNTLRKKYGCSFVEMEVKEKITGIPREKNAFWKPLFVIYDVYGKTDNGKIFIVEIGKIEGWKLKYLKDLNDRKLITFFYEEFPHSPVIWVK